MMRLATYKLNKVKITSLQCLPKQSSVFCIQISQHYSHSRHHLPFETSPRFSKARNLNLHLNQTLSRMTNPQNSLHHSSQTKNGLFQIYFHFQSPSPARRKFGRKKRRRKKQQQQKSTADNQFS